MISLLALTLAWAAPPVATPDDDVERDSVEEADSAPRSAWDEDPRPTSVFGLGGGFSVPDVSMRGSVRLRLTKRTTLAPVIGWGRADTRPVTEGPTTSPRSTIAAEGGLELRERVWHNDRSDIPLLLGVYGSFDQLRTDATPWDEITEEAKLETTTIEVLAGIAVERWVAPGVVLSGSVYVPLGGHSWNTNGLQPALPPVQQRTWTTLGVPRAAVTLHVFP